MPPDAPVVDYDGNADVLYICTQPGKHGIATESLPGVFWRYGVADDGIVGVTIVDFVGYWDSRLNDLAHDLREHLHISHQQAHSLLRIDV